MIQACAISGGSRGGACALPPHVWPCNELWHPPDALIHADRSIPLAGSDPRASWLRGYIPPPSGQCTSWHMDLAEHPSRYSSHAFPPCSVHVLQLLPVTSAKVERAHSAFKLIKTKMSSTTGEDRVNALSCSIFARTSHTCIRGSH